MSEESITNESSSQVPQSPVTQRRPLSLLPQEQQGWNPQPIPQLSDLEELNRYHNFHREWVAQNYGIEAISLPPQHFLVDPTYPPYLRSIGMTILDKSNNIEIPNSVPTATSLTTKHSNSIASPSPQQAANSPPSPIQSIQTQSIPNPRIAVTPKHRLSEQQKLVVVHHCIVGVKDYTMMGKTEFFGIQREIIKRTEGFD
ncbi:hypothetical protein HOY82DRAFT_535986 [Tuber indicum]|nr:hypothetical protein HOY82DRAFT_535986 [Tuber indicum]